MSNNRELLVKIGQLLFASSFCLRRLLIYCYGGASRSILREFTGGNERGITGKLILSNSTFYDTTSLGNQKKGGFKRHCSSPLT
jgi:hypothetical protein